ncbi:hypothetical protein ACIRQ1_53135, partial [Streptomyces sp. NPDC101455]
MPWTPPAGRALGAGAGRAPRDGKSFVEIDFALANADEIWLGEAKKTSALSEGHRDIKKELCKLIDGCKAVAADRLILATAAPAWNTATTTVVRGPEVSGQAPNRVVLNKETRKKWRHPVSTR